MPERDIKRRRLSAEVPQPNVVLPEVTGEGRLEAAEFVADKREVFGEAKPMSLANKVALITAGGSRVGRMAALLLAREGARLVVVDSDGDAARDTVQLASEMQAQAVYVQADLSRASEAERAVATAVDSFGGLDIVFICAVAEQEMASRRVEHIAEREWHDVFDLILSPIFSVVKYAVPVLRQRGGGVIIIGASIYGLVGSDVSAAYAAAQGAAIQLARQLAVQCARDRIRVNAVAAPALGPATQPTGEQSRSSRADQLIAMYPLGRLGKPEDVAEVVVYLASAEADFITGVVVPVDGGYTAR